MALSCRIGSPALFHRRVAPPRKVVRVRRLIFGLPAVAAVYGSCEQIACTTCQMTSHNRHSTSDSFGCRQFFHSTIDCRYSSRTSTFCPKPLIALPNSFSNIISLPDVVLGCSALLFIASKRPLVP